MENADKPISPTFIKFTENGNPRPVSEYEVSRGGYSDFSIGLTKREYFAGLALQGLVGNTHNNSPKFIAEVAIKISDELLKQLENN
ncbi:hypothetical protein [Chryseobacterium defluvii]|uniref:Uncharacterized protein n=1 Tax=Chryseobacterium defluvii TaxID=160396 RepID=A0A495SLB5_9FLAO|nr:hypothetical protein [Chryseobacterium defluvii]RKT01061.1 hypothetical protein BCF58_0272 [Chryseobacterium defluvii]